MNLTDDDVREILRLLDESPYDELTLETDRFRLVLRNSAQRSWIRKGPGRRDFAPHTPAPPRRDEAPAAPAAPGAGIREIRPPMPGTFYRAPSPGAEPFTEVGRTVEEDTILGLVETMKLMNSVVAGCRGEVVEICAGNAAPVDVEDVLVRIRVAPDG